MRLLGEGEDPSPVEDGKERAAAGGPREGGAAFAGAWKPSPDHSWRRPFKPDVDEVAPG